MARQMGIFRLTGKLGDLSFYSNSDGYFVKQSSGHSAERIKNAPEFVRTRENYSEFGECAKVGKFLRESLFDLLYGAKDNKVTQRVTQLMSNIKDLDVISDRGKRHVDQGLENPDGRVLMTGFDFNEHAPLSYVLGNTVDLDTDTGKISIPGFVPEQQLHYPKSATHVELQGGWLRIDFEHRKQKLVLTNMLRLSLDETMTDVALMPSGEPTGAGTDIFVLRIGFKQEMNGEMYELKDKGFNACGVVGVVISE